MAVENLREERIKARKKAVQSCQIAHLPLTAGPSVRWRLLSETPNQTVSFALLPSQKVCTFCEPQIAGRQL